MLNLDCEARGFLLASRRTAEDERRMADKEGISNIDQGILNDEGL